MAIRASSSGYPQRSLTDQELQKFVEPTAFPGQVAVAVAGADGAPVAQTVEQLLTSLLTEVQRLRAGQILAPAATCIDVPANALAD